MRCYGISENFSKLRNVSSPADVLLPFHFLLSSWNFLVDLLPLVLAVLSENVH
jgi:hypothetical protein